MMIPDYSKFSTIELQQAAFQAKVVMNSTYGREITVPFTRYKLGFALLCLIQAEQRKRIHA